MVPNREEAQQGPLRRCYRLTESGARTLEAEAVRLAGNPEIGNAI